MGTKPETKLKVGLGLIAAGLALVGVTIGSAVWHDAEVKAVSRAAANAAEEASQRVAAAELSAMETKVTRAAALQPLNSALNDHVDGPTVADLFENEDWWQSYRDEFTGARLYLGRSVFATWGRADFGAQDADVVKAARAQNVGSKKITVDGQTYLIAAGRMPALPEREPVLVLARMPSQPLAPTAPAPTAAAPAPPSVTQAGLAVSSPLPWAAAALALAGLAMVIASRRRTVLAYPPGQGYGAWEPPVIEVDGRGLDPGLTPSGSFSATAPMTVRPSRVMAPPSGAPRTATPYAAEGLPPSPRPSAAVTLPQLNFGRYRITSRLAEGGMSEIYTAEFSGVEGFTRNFVLKRLRPALAHDRDAVANFIDEARTQADLVHSNIVPVFDFGRTDDNEYFMTQELIIGRDLTRLILRHHDHTGECLDPRIGYYVAYETLQALAYAHSRVDRDGVPMSIVHRDVSPGNILISLQGEVKLSDFGIARANRRVTTTQFGVVKGNTDFMSPEQARGGAVDGRSDLFSLGEVLYYCLTNELVYGGDNDLEALFKAATGPTKDHLAKLRGLPYPAAGILEKALAIDPQARFQSAVEFADALAPHIAGGKALLMKLMPELFGHELRQHQAA
jgi:serine/threonine-protein kinase